MSLDKKMKTMDWIYFAKRIQERGVNIGINNFDERGVSPDGYMIIRKEMNDLTIGALKNCIVLYAGATARTCNSTEAIRCTSMLDLAPRQIKSYFHLPTIEETQGIIKCSDVIKQISGFNVKCNLWTRTSYGIYTGYAVTMNGDVITWKNSDNMFATFVAVL